MKYLRAALFHPLHLTALATVALTAVVVPDPGHTLAGAALLEALYLLWVPRSRWFRARVDAARRLQSLPASEEDEADLLQQIDGFNRQRYLRLRHMRDSIRQSVGPSHAAIVASELQKLDRLLDSFLRLLANATRYRKHLEKLEEDDIRAKVDRATRALETSSDPELRAMQMQNLDILRRRLQEVGRFRVASDRVETQLEMIENTFAYVADKFVAMCPPEEVSSDLDALIANVERTEAVVAELAPVIRRLEESARRQPR